ncbi:odorant receptor 67d-like [Culicoides brevitarsis]|uniref:odorant receptor 67d-like n=1 Tax=Culicoides brevitarsis TaxID=469753 RepID=UPI00307BE6E2
MWTIKRDEAIWIIKHLMEFVKKWNEFPETKEVLKWYYKILHRLIFGLLGFTASCIIILILAPLFCFVLTGQRRMFVQCFIPGLDYNASPGFEIHIIYLGWCGFCIISGIGSLTAFDVLILVQNCIEVDVLRARLLMLKALVRMGNQHNKNLEKSFKEIFVQHQEMNKCMENCEKFLSMQHTTDHFIIGVQACLSLFICMREFWPAGIILFFSGLIVIFLSNLLGSLIDAKLESLANDIYDVPWYLMTVKNRKMYCYFLGNAQKTNRFTLAGYLPLSLNTFARFYKGSYSYLMVLRKIEQ